MYPAEFIKGLKQNNISQDGEKTKERFEAIWKAASNKEKDSILELAGIARGTIYRVYNTGSISAKIVISCAQVLNVSPLYLTGASDEHDECDESILRELLEQLGYSANLEAFDKEAKKTERKAKRLQEKESAAAICAETACPDCDCVESSNVNALGETEAQVEERFDAEMKAALLECAEVYNSDESGDEQTILELSAVDPETLENLDEDSIILLLRSLLLRAGIGVPDAVDKAALVKRILLS